MCFVFVRTMFSIVFGCCLCVDLVFFHVFFPVLTYPRFPFFVVVCFCFCRFPRMWGLLLLRVKWKGKEEMLSVAHSIRTKWNNCCRFVVFLIFMSALFDVWDF